IALSSESIIWSPAGSVSCSTCDTILVNPSSSTILYATATNQFSCTSTDSVFVKVYTPFTASTEMSNIYICKDEHARLNVSPPDTRISWSPTTGLVNADSHSPIASPSQNTTYSAALTDSVGCFTDTAVINVFIKSLPTVDAGPDKILPFNEPFTLTPVYGNTIVSYLWTPSVLLSCGTCPTPAGTAATTRQYTITVTSDSGCVAKD